jgi:hypothetical protein
VKHHPDLRNEINRRLYHRDSFSNFLNLQASEIPAPNQGIPVCDAGIKHASLTAALHRPILRLESEVEREKTSE